MSSVTELVEILGISAAFGKRCLLLMNACLISFSSCNCRRFGEGETGARVGEEDEVTAGELLLLRFHEPQWLKVNLQGASSHQTCSRVLSCVD